MQAHNSVVNDLAHTLFEVVHTAHRYLYYNFNLQTSNYDKQNMFCFLRMQKQAYFAVFKSFFGLVFPFFCPKMML